LFRRRCWLRGRLLGTDRGPGAAGYTGRCSQPAQGVRFLKIVSNPKRTPLLIHCQHGADRTGTLSAVYRVAVQGWSREEAIREMTQGGYGFHDIWVNLVPWFKKLDIKAVKQKAGI